MCEQKGSCQRKLGEYSMREMNLRGRVAVITGGSRGIGRAVVEKLSEEGAHVVINYVRDEQAAQASVDFAQALGVDALAVRADVQHLSEAEELVRVTLERFKRVDYLICNAGVWEGAPVEEIDEELWDRVIDII